MIYKKKNDADPFASRSPDPRFFFSSTALIILISPHSCVGVVPEPRPRRDSDLVAHKTVLVKVEDGKFARCHHVALWVLHDPVPDLR